MVEEFGQDLVVVGQYLGDCDRADKIIKGTFKYSGDHQLQNKLFGRTLGSPFAHAKILSINTSKAEALDGVEAVITYEDNPNWDSEMLCWGQEYAAVAAVDEYTAERALLLIEAEWEELDFNLDGESAMKPNAPLTGTFADTNIGSPRTYTRGDIEAGWAEADVRIEREYGWGRPHTQNTIEPCSGVAWWEGEDVYGFDCNQNPHSSNSSYARSLGVSQSRCHIKVWGTGGGFGGGGQTNEPVAAALLAKKAGKPVQMMRTRRMQTPSRRNHYAPKLKMRIGWNSAEEKLTAIECIWWTWGGRNAGRGGYNENLDVTFMCDNIHYESYGVATNTGFCSGYR